MTHTSMPKRYAIGLGTAAAVAALLAPVSAAEPLHLPAGCAHAGRVVAHHAGAQVIWQRPSQAPVACWTTTGFAASESDLVVTNDGAFVYAPAIPPVDGVGFPGFVGNEVGGGGLAISSPGGGRWRAVVPPESDGLSHQDYKPLDDHLFIDRTTNRVFWNTTGTPFSGIGLSVSYSDDDGKTWGYSSTGLRAAENARLTVAQPRQSRTYGYPHMVYLCANTSIVGGIEPQGGARICSKSDDGGATWHLLGQGLLFSKPVPQHAECGSSAEEFGPLDGNYPQAATDGTLYVVVSCGGQNYLARSSDEGASWPIIHVGQRPLTVPQAGQLRMDSRNDMYDVWSPSRGQLRYTVSHDLGRTWSKGLDVIAPGVAAVKTWAVAVDRPGTLVFSYYGARKGQPTWDGYLTETRDGLARNPLFFSAQVNDHAHPLLYGSTSPDPLLLYDYNGAAIGPTGDGWGAFVEDCGAQLTAPSCTARIPSRTTVPNDGFVAGLVWP